MSSSVIDFKPRLARAAMDGSTAGLGQTLRTGRSGWSVYSAREAPHLDVTLLKVAPDSVASCAGQQESVMDVLIGEKRYVQNFEQHPGCDLERRVLR